MVEGPYSIPKTIFIFYIALFYIYIVGLITLDIANEFWNPEKAFWVTALSRSNFRR